MYFSDHQIAELHEGLNDARRKGRDLQERFVLRQLENGGAREHADHGFSRRLGALVRSIEQVFELLPPELDDVPAGNATEDAAISIQAFIMNAFGCCENLAWIWILERDIRAENGTEISPNRVGLGPKYATVRRSFSPEFNRYLDTRSAWFEHLKDFRDALAHRIPLYIPPFSIEAENRDRWVALGHEANASHLAGDLVRETELRVQRAALRRFTPVMTHTLNGGAPVVVFHFQLLIDFVTVHELAGEFLAELDR